MSEQQLVVFRLGNEEYGVPIFKVKEIIQYNGATKLPNTPGYMEGVINLRGSIIPVVDLATKFKLPHRQNDDVCAIIFEIEEGEIAVIVDEVTEVVTLQDSMIELVPDAMNSPYLSGIGKILDRLIILFDIERVFEGENSDILRAG